MYLVSVIIPSYNRFDFLLNAIDSVKNQTYKNIEIIIVNDKSTQQEYYTYDFEGCKILHLDKNSKVIVGFPCAGYVRNIGINSASGQYICFLDDDDIFLPNKIELQIESIQSSKNKMSSTDGYFGYGVYNSNKKYSLYNEEHYRDYILKTINYPEYPDNITKEILYRHNLIITSSVMIETSLVKEVGGFKHIKNGLEDYDLWKRCIEHTNCDYIKTPCFYYDGYHGYGQNYT
jgi:glycosyltransferase involved in cell wall biosynthesis